MAYGRIEAVRQVDLEVRQPASSSASSARTAPARPRRCAPSPASWRRPPARSRSRARPITGLPSHAVVAARHRDGAGRPQVFADQTVEDNLMLGAYLRAGKDDAGVAATTLERVLGAVPGAARAADAAGRLAVRRRAADAGDRARAAVAARSCWWSTSSRSGSRRRSSISCFRCWSISTAQGLSILLVEQMASYALQVTHRTYVMENGRILMHGDSGDARQRSARARRLSGAARRQLISLTNPSVRTG